MVELWNKLLKFWFSLPQPLRFLLVGGFDTVVAFLFYSILIYAGLHYSLALVINYIFSVNLSILNMRYFVYQSKGKLIKGYSKGWVAYLSTLCLNYIGLFILIDVLKIGEIKAQMIYTIFATLYIYFLHKYFTFHKHKDKTTKNPFNVFKS